jgi:hypothetical protein
MNEREEENVKLIGGKAREKEVTRNTRTRFEYER